ncbi:Uncharacterised protein [Vibrio cholerae]|nr:Uncharacterised protein [Vibrio cholerae]CSI62102.1 Uncharacterised protein [Vibrio cholerae]
MTTVFFKQLLTHLVRVGQITVVSKCDTERRVDIERLSF